MVTRRILGCLPLAASLALAGGTSSPAAQAEPGQSEVISVRGRPTRVVKSGREETRIDQETGVPVFYLGDVRPEAETRQLPLLSREEAGRAAAAFLQRWKIDLSAWTAEESALVDHGAGGQNYYFRWSKRLQGVYLPGYATLGVDARAGTVNVFTLLDDAVAIPLAWRISAGDAAAAVARARGWARWELQDVSLRVWYRGSHEQADPRRQALLWRVTLANPAGKTPAERYVKAEVDANTGQVVTVYQFGGSPPASGKGNPDAAKLLAAQPAPGKEKLTPPVTLFEQAARKKPSSAAEAAQADRP